MSQLQPFNPPIGCTQYVNPNQETRLILKEKVMSITGDAFDIKLDPQNGQPPQPVFKVDPSWITTKKAFYDMAGNHLFDMKKEWMHLVHRTFKIVDPQGVKFFEVKSGLTFVGSKATATFTSAGGKEETLVMKGNWRDATADIIDETRGAVAARIARKSAFKSFTTFMTGQNEYSLTVAPGVDFALMAALCVCFDEFNNDSAAGGA
ncbi:hypothetical protein KVR01_008108 [Diaporthe batatas]|uniref:uncharacterized protein n=1 Tax=Diaporthe batatas TaxID=748121 RepID=UPI001D047E04|nr:uncharacterized protein KVR01_008108 [Diaporthe batatas]KAG8162343.1 hypothetical protein KVR01_008108 [Diaporthe batatas]